ncbi:MAG: hypothetical protein HYZ58_09400 [Acidobacteria bacterium]|nr:hypothetical protein [Acidobacteriota bacterium]MBI3263352.1 hypothetical protein [Acidobacteriota bacterium]
MFSNYEIAASEPVRTTLGDATHGIFARMMASVRQAICGLHGHDSLLHFEENRVCLRCTSCGYETPGWSVDAKRPRLRYSGDDQRYRPAGRSIIRPRRVA